MEKRNALLTIDPQNCFMDYTKAPLPVPGARSDMKRLRDFIGRMQEVIDYICVSYDQHPFDHISHPNRWVDRDGNHPEPFTIITIEAYVAGDWRAADPKDQEWQGEYLRLLDRPHCIWPVHGQPGEWEQKIQSGLLTSLSFCHDQGIPCDYYAKGMHRDTEQFGLFGASVPFPGAPETNINHALIKKLDAHDQIAVAGEASSHCVMDSVKQLIEFMPSQDPTKIALLTDCMSPVPGFELVADDWLSDMDAIGVRLVKSTTFSLTQ